jgi:hypothetical protein
MRFDAPRSLNHKLHVLASQLGVTVRELMIDGAYLALRFHGAGFGVPQPQVRVPVTEDDRESPVEMETDEEQDGGKGGAP